MSLTTKDELLVIPENLALVRKAAEGLEAKYFVSLQKHSGFRKDELAALLGLDPKTVDNYRNAKKKFKSDAAEKLLKLHRLFALGEELFGSSEELMDWLEIPSPGLENQRPIALLHSISGITEVEKQLLRIAHGYAA
ncbi:type II RES/Xre toxin-antitoxin system antitoxin [Nafulsella turpanensis]|uniref:type II RES/Xre toxin-antitoxin system antitoxin n=1 Tax=Nafulsella turpanensis TaxID=1265690 RepID=UPI00034C5457|nr:antitoxin Xre/MbcA/ParS toxin-binding domain-containing protein [Nafulsella turpanensis]